MDFKAQFNWLLQESWALLHEPKTFWKEKLVGGFKQLVIGTFFLPLVILAGLAVLLGEIWWNDEILWSYSSIKALREVVSYFLQYFVSAIILFRLLQNFKGTDNKIALYNVLSYSLLPFLIASVITGLFPGLYVLGIVGLYGFYLFIVGSQTCLEIPKENQSRFIILSILLIVLIFGTINAISWKLFQVLFPYGA
ncbi:YIP1 family protein [Mangrovibacterium lignilyticum]|uniref:YIP1 family protein n=1 Tax=Mangrovibacterium lignilyticum TaxID=2668052 RepID=UPI0013D25D5C|nr:YIP1 family protein [Mangrovibacterium lignilyticum]